MGQQHHVRNCYYYDNAHDYATVGSRRDNSGTLTNVARTRRITLGSGITAVSPAASSYRGTVKVADGQALTDGSGNILTGTLAPADVNGKTLAPAFTITYDLAGGMVTTDNPTVYTEESETFTLNNPTRDGHTFAGWTGTDLDVATETVTIAKGSTGNRKYTATWTENVLTLLDDDRNSDTKNATIIGSADGDGKQYKVTLQDRTLYKDGFWNTLCLPFDVDLTDIDCPLYGATAKVLDETASGLDGGTLTLKFREATAIEAGMPFLIKWEAAEDYVGRESEYDLVDPVFGQVTIAATAPTEVAFTGGKFVGQFSPFAIDGTNIRDILFVGSANKIGYSGKNRILRSCRAHFEVPADGDANAALRIEVDYGEGGEVTDIQGADVQTAVHMEGWHALNGMKLEGKPANKGVYIHDGKKVVIQ
ncbi:MAG: InlB B-repeat-containing protein [Bacteroidaceae bacterium]|nr:InlB B-repeat-containing protein [Bacteroidaceae bacterium]